MLYWASEHEIVSTEGWSLRTAERSREECTLIYRDPEGREIGCWLFIFPDQRVNLQFPGWSWQPTGTPATLPERAMAIDNVREALAFQRLWVQSLRQVRATAGLRPAETPRGQVAYQGGGAIRWTTGERSLTVTGFEDSRGRVAIPTSQFDCWNPPHSEERLTPSDRHDALVAITTWLEDHGQSLHLKR